MIHVVMISVELIIGFACCYGLYVDHKEGERRAKNKSSL